MIRLWRIAWSKRQQINIALQRERKAKSEAIAISRKADHAIEEAQRTTTKANERVAMMGSYIIAEQCSEHIKSIKAENYHAKEKRILRSIEVAAQNGYRLPIGEQNQLSRMLKQAHDMAIRAGEEKQRQAEIREQMREEERAQREYDRLVKQADKERKQKEREAQIRQNALEEAIALLGDTHSEQIEEMKRKLAEAQAEAEAARLASERALSMAQQTKRGHIYIISNIGSFGHGVFKVGMTRRLEPLDRIRELGDASVPFSFDVHAMISSDNAPALEASLHRRLDQYRVNRVNLRKEFFRIDLAAIIEAVRDEHGEVDYVADAEALEYLESIAIAEEHGTLESRILAEASSEDDE